MLDGQSIINGFLFSNPNARLKHNNKYTKKFIKYNKQLLDGGVTDKIVFDDNLIYNTTKDLASTLLILPPLLK